MRKQHGFILAVFVLILIIVGVILNLVVMRSLMTAGEVQALNVIQSAYAISLAKDQHSPTLIDLLNHIRSNDASFYVDQKYQQNSKNIEMLHASGVKILVNHVFYLVPTYQDKQCEKPTERITDTVRCMGKINPI